MKQTTGFSFTGISGSTLKIIAIISMLIDHSAAALIRPFRPKLSATYPVVGGFLVKYYSTMRAIGRIAFPIFCFLLVEGFLHTRNKKKYAFRLFLFALISELPFEYALKTKLFDWNYQNVYFTLLIGLLVMWLVQYFDYKPARNHTERCIYFLIEIAVLAGGSYLAQYIHCDYRARGIILIETLYLLRMDKNIQAIFGALAISWETTGPLAFLPIWLYNGKRGLNLKYFFYWFYPGHLLILGMIRHIVMPLIF